MRTITQTTQITRLLVLSALMVLFVFSVNNSFSQAKFQMVIGSSGSEWCRDIVKTTDGGYAIAASTTSFGVSLNDVYIIKLNSSCNIQWTKSIGGSSYDNGFSIVQSADGGFVVAGETYTFGAGYIDFYVVKVDASGNLQWTRTIGGTAADGSYTLTKTSDGGYIVLGYTYSFGQGSSDGYTVKLDNAGNVQWTRTIGGPGHDLFTSAVQNPDGSFVITGATDSYGKGGDDVYIVKLSPSGALLWTKTIGGTGNEGGFSIVRTFDGGYVIAQATNSFGAGSNDVYVVKISSNGGLLWTRTIGGSNAEYGYPIIQTADSGFVIAGQTNSFGLGGNDAYVVKLNKTGVLQWTRVIGGNADELAFSIFQTSDCGYIVGGLTGSFGAGGDDVYMFKLDNAGTTCNNTTTGGTSSTGGALDSGGIAGTGGIYGNGGTITGSGGVITTLCVVLDVKNISTEIPNDYFLYQNYPNPFNPTTKIKFAIPPLSSPPSEGGDRGVVLIIYDILGKEVANLIPPIGVGQEGLKPGTYEIEWDASNYPSGVYFYKLDCGDFTDVKKMVLIK